MIEVIKTKIVKRMRVKRGKIYLKTKILTWFVEALNKKKCKYDSIQRFEVR